MINVLIVEPFELPYEKEIPNTLEAKQKIVGGHIECTCLLDDDSVSIICNEEGKIRGLPLNRDIGYDIIAGTFIIAGDDYENGEFKSLTDAQILKYKIKFGKESIERTNRKLNAIRIEIALNRNRSYESER